MAVGAIAGVLWSARRGRPTLTTLVAGTALLGIAFVLAALAPVYALFAAALALIGVTSMIFINATNPLMQLSTEPAMRGRVMALRIGLGLGATPVGAPILGWVADRFGPRWALGIGAASGFAAALIGAWARFRATKRSA
jgi:MFS family permease